MKRQGEKGKEPMPMSDDIWEEEQNIHDIHNARRWRNNLREAGRALTDLREVVQLAIKYKSSPEELRVALDKHTRRWGHVRFF